jgi:hypothetical protein
VLPPFAPFWSKSPHPFQFPTLDEPMTTLSGLQSYRSKDFCRKHDGLERSLKQTLVSQPRGREQVPSVRDKIIVTDAAKYWRYPFAFSVSEKTRFAIRRRPVTYLANVCTQNLIFAIEEICSIFIWSCGDFCERACPCPNHASRVSASSVRALG